METILTGVRSVLTRSSGYLETVCSHSLQPYRGCPLGSSLCGVGCYVRSNWHVTRGRPWGSFLEVRRDAAESYRRTCNRERLWARRVRGEFSIYLSSSSEPFPAQESRFGVTSAVLDAMLEDPPDTLIIQTHSHHVAAAADRLWELSRRCATRVHVSIETDRDRIDGLPPPGSSIDHRFEAAGLLKERGIRVVVTVSPLLPISDPDRFFERIAASANAVVLDHFVGGDGTPDGRRTSRTALPAAIAAIDPSCLDLSYRDRMAAVARRHLPGRVGIHIDGFAGRFLSD